MPHSSGWPGVRNVRGENHESSKRVGRQNGQRRKAVCQTAQPPYSLMGNWMRNEKHCNRTATQQGCTAAIRQCTLKLPLCAVWYCPWDGPKLWNRFLLVRSDWLKLVRLQHFSRFRTLCPICMLLAPATQAASSGQKAASGCHWRNSGRRGA